MSENEIIFKVSVPYNSKYLVKKRKKHNLIGGTIFSVLFAAVFAGFALILSSHSDGMLAIKVLMGVIMVGTLGGAVFYFAKNESREANKDSSLDFVFMENTFCLARSNKKTTMENCLYQKKAGMQYINKAIESKDFIKFEILKGYYNFVPQYVKHFLPKETLGEKELSELIEFLKAKLGERYTTV